MSKRKAIKQHNCILCNKPIEKGSEYVYQRITPWDHVLNETFFDYKAHIECDKIWIENGYEWDWEFPDNWDEFLEYT